jgi:hypothetical protein
MSGRFPDESAGKRRSGKTRKGSMWLDYTLEDAAMAAIRASDNYLSAQYQRLRIRRGQEKAPGAVKHPILCACWHMLSTGELYRDLGGVALARVDRIDVHQASPSGCFQLGGGGAGDVVRIRKRHAALV